MSSRLRYFITLSTIAGFMAVATAANSQTYHQTRVINATVKAGSSAEVTYFFHLNLDCSSPTPPIARSIDTPKRGRITFRIGQRHTTYSKDNPRYRCNRKRSPVLIFIYRAYPGRAYSGSFGADTFSVELFWNDGDVWKITMNVAVQ